MTIWYTFIYILKQLRISIGLNFYHLNILRTFLEVGKECKFHLYFCLLKNNNYSYIFWTSLCNFGAFYLCNEGLILNFNNLRASGALGLGLGLEPALVRNIRWWSLRWCDGNIGGIAAMMVATTMIVASVVMVVIETKKKTMLTIMVVVSQQVWYIFM